MKSCATCVYWILILTWIVSTSGFLLLIVASEPAQAKEQSLDIGKGRDSPDYDNLTIDGDANKVPPDIVLIKKKDKEKNLEENEATTIFASFENYNNEETKKERSLKISMESLTQQPNLSQGISETGQAVVLTMVDTAAAELQSLAKPKISLEFHSKTATGNSSDTNTIEQQELIQVPPAIEEEAVESLNATDIIHQESNEENFATHKAISEEAPEVVVVVRAEQKILSNEVVKAEEAFDAVSELNDTAARAHLARDESTTAAVIIDGLVTSGTNEPHEDIPSFSEWAQKRLEEAEKKKTHPNVSVQTPVNSGRGMGNMKVRSKNYAAPDCGAKIVAANPEAGNTKSVLASTRDEYMLNTCTTRVWFVVELCEAIQAKKIELANFELFSSSPKDFSVYISDRFPTRDWSLVGQLTAKDERDVQSFSLYPHLFGKFIKVELHSHYGSEHFCPISLFRAYGTSEFEVLETETDTENQAPQEISVSTDDDEDSDEEEPIEIDNGEPSRNLFGSARDAVLNIVKKAAEVLVKSNGKNTNVTGIRQNASDNNNSDNTYSGCITPRYNIHCTNCNDERYARVYRLISCRDRQLDQLLKSTFVRETLPSFCGSETDDSEEGVTKFDLVKSLRVTFLASVFQPEYIIALCNIMNCTENKITVNASQEVPSSELEANKKEETIKIERNESAPLLNIQQTAQAIDSSDIESSSYNEQKPGEESSEKSEIVVDAAAATEAEKMNSESESKIKTTSSTILHSFSSSEQLTSQIKPTKTLSREDIKKESSFPTLESSKESVEEIAHSDSFTASPSLLDVGTRATKISEEESTYSENTIPSSKIVTVVSSTTVDVQEPVESIGNEGEAIEAETKPKVEAKAEQTEQRKLKPEVKVEQDKAKPEVINEESKMSVQDHMALDSLFSDLKDLENDVANLQNGQVASASIAQPTASSTPQQKESVFLRLSNRIKALERNMSLSGQYLEELSRRYKKQVEEMQRMLERALTAMGEESRKGDEREIKRNEEVAVLKEEIAILSKSVETLLYDRDSWRSRFSAIGQHAFLICFEVIIVVFILAYCRRSNNLSSSPGQLKPATNTDSVRRKSAENLIGHISTKKTKKRRPSEIASRISGTYQELMIDEKVNEPKREKKKKRKKDGSVSSRTTIAGDARRRDTILYKSALNSIPGGSDPPTRRVSSIEAPSRFKSLPEDTKRRRPESAPETSVSWLDETSEKKITYPPTIVKSSSIFDSEQSFDHPQFSESNSSTATIDKLRPAHSIDDVSDLSSIEIKPNKIKGSKLSSPFFMETALGSRKKRIVPRRSLEQPQLRSDDCEWYSKHSNASGNSPSNWPDLSEVTVSPNGKAAANGHVEDKSQSGSSSGSSAASVKKEKTNSLKKMVRKFF